MNPDWRCRHCDAEWGSDFEYCPACDRNYGGAIYPETQTAEELAEVERLVGVISNAFRDVQLEDGQTIHEADREGIFFDDFTQADARAKDPETRWQDVPDWKIEQVYPLCFFDLKGWRFHIPAYMVWTLRNWRSTCSVNADSTISSLYPSESGYILVRFKSLSREQSAAVYQFLKFFCEYSKDLTPRMAVWEYWRHFAPDETTDRKELKD